MFFGVSISEPSVCAAVHARLSQSEEGGPAGAPDPADKAGTQIKIPPGHCTRSRHVVRAETALL